jgi:cytidine deaminase
MYPIDLVRHKDPELFFALVAPIGTDVEGVCDALTESLNVFNYAVKFIRVVEELRQIKGPDSYLDKEPTNAYEKTKARMDAGDKFRSDTNLCQALAILSLTSIRRQRKEKSGNVDVPAARQAYLLRSLKRPEEVTALRQIYASNLIVIAVHAGRELRVKNMAQRIAKSEYSAQEVNYRDKAEELVLRDESDERKKFGQRLRKAFALADVFLDSSNPQRLRQDLNRFLDVLFGKPVITPTRDEVGMAYAYLAGVRSAEMGRQVGAAICDQEGNVVATGTNEVPKAHGGCYWDGDDPDGRDWAKGYDSSDHFKSSSLGELLKTFSDKGLLSEELEKLPTPEQMKKVKPLLKETRYMQLIEFVRAVHGEMSALTTAAARGVPVAGCTLFVTTFPCHECARHIVASGIKRVVYIEPYAKSLAIELHGDSIELDTASDPNKIPFLPFIGVAPKNYSNIFAMPDRKGGDGMVIAWNAADAKPRVSGSFWSYLKYEAEALKKLTDEFKKMGVELSYNEDNHEGNH